MREEELEVALKVVIVGDGGVGKSSMIQRYCRGTFTRDYKKTIGVDFLERQIEIDGEEVRLMLWDTAGQEEFDAITKAYYRGAHACVLAFSTTDRDSFLALHSWKLKVLCTLSFLATGSYQKIVGVGQHLTQRTTSRCISEVVNALNHNWMVSKWIVFPQTPHERSLIKEKFQRIHNLPGVIGCIDCTHIAITRPVEEEHTFFNRKGYHSLNVQMICDYDLRIINVNSKFGGATHDSHIWSASHVGTYMQGLHESGEHVWLLGDSGYPLRPWLMTPILNAEPGSQEEVYTRRHVQARSRIERCFGLLKARWRCMLRHRVLHYHPYMASKITNACSVLHNIALDARIPPPSDMPAGGLEDSEDHAVQYSTSTNDNQNELIRGRAMRNRLVSRM